jgi:ubiquinone/menaquinone biosynthesis C-methylase UbiE
VTDRETRRLSFGSVATDYDRYRPSPPSAALDWLIPPGAQAVLDLAAGTGAVTRELVGRAPRVIAVEPDERMRGVLTARCPEAEVLAGRGEAIPLPDASVDAVVISAAWHWLDPDGVITLDPQRRADFSRRVRAFLDRQPWDRADVPLICRCLRSTRLDG